jgi:hypothetical protein
MKHEHKMKKNFRFSDLSFQTLKLDAAIFVQSERTLLTVYALVHKRYIFNIYMYAVQCTVYI